MAPSFFSSVLPQTEATDRFITAQQVREIRAQLRRMSEQNSIDAIKDSSHQRVDTEQRRVPGTLVISDDLDEKVKTRVQPFLHINSLVRKSVAFGEISDGSVSEFEEGRGWKDYSCSSTF